MSELPQGWVLAKIEDLVNLNPKNDLADDTAAGFVPMPMMATDFLETVRFEERRWGDIKKGYTHFADGDVLLAKITPCFENGKAGIPMGLPNGMGAGSTEYFVLRPNDAVFAKYLLAYLKTANFLKEGEINMTGSVGHKRVPKDFLMGRRIPLAPMPEQKRIADKLDIVLARLDSARARLERVPALLKRFRQAVLAAAVDGKLTEEWRVRRQSRDWERDVPLSDLCESILDGDHQAPPQANAGIPFITISAINDGRLSLEKVTRFVPKSYFDGLKDERKPRINDILYSVTGSICIPALVDVKEMFVFQRHIAILRVAPGKVSPRFLYYWLGSDDAKKQGAEAATGTAQLTVPLKKLRQFRLNLPPLQEQNEIVNCIEALFALADSIQAQYDRACERLDELLPALLAKSFRGELVPQSPDDEPAEKLLGRVKARIKTAPGTRKRARISAN